MFETFGLWKNSSERVKLLSELKIEEGHPPPQESSKEGEEKQQDGEEEVECPICMDDYKRKDMIIHHIVLGVTLFVKIVGNDTWRRKSRTRENAS